jgi:hypothetical protein
MLPVFLLLLFLSRVSPARPAPAEFPQGWKAARAGSCSGAMQVAYPLFFGSSFICFAETAVAESKINFLLCAAFYKTTVLYRFRLK